MYYSLVKFEALKSSGGGENSRSRGGGCVAGVLGPEMINFTCVPAPAVVYMAAGRRSSLTLISTQIPRARTAEIWLANSRSQWLVVRSSLARTTWFAHHQISN
jgi:hypothetical protein